MNVPGSALAGSRAVPRRQAAAAQLAARPRQHQLALPLKVAAARIAAAKGRPAEPAGLERARSRLRALGLRCGVLNPYADAKTQPLRQVGRVRLRAGTPERTQQRGVRQASVQAQGLPQRQRDLARGRSCRSLLCTREAGAAASGKGITGDHAESVGTAWWPPV